MRVTKSKNKLIALYKILKKYSDELHPLSMKEIQDLMLKEGCSCSDDTICRYIRQLQTDLQLDIVSGKGCNAKYFLGERFLENEEIKLLIDAVNASNFIDEKHTRKIVSKLKETVSIYDADSMERSVIGINSTKTENKKILYNINKIQQAIDSNCQISFDYLKWNPDKELEVKNTRKNTLSPWAMIWANDRYYIYGYDVKLQGGKYTERHYRIDKMDAISILDINRTGRSQFKEFEANTYVSRRIGMFSGTEKRVTVEVDNSIVGAFIDQFGREIDVKKLSEHSSVISFFAVPAPSLYGWFASLGGINIKKPLAIKNKYIQFLDNAIKNSQ